jgi:PAS domain S-box-containing protein
VTTARLLPGSIRGKLVLSCSLLVGGMALFAAFFFPSRLERQAMRATVAKAAAVRDLTAYSVSAALYFGDTTAAREVLDAALRDPGVESVALADTTGRTVLFVGTPRSRDALARAASGSISANGQVYVTSTRIVHAGTVLGVLSIVTSLQDLKREVASARQTGLLVGLMLLIAGVGLVYGIGLLVTRPLRHVSATVKRIAAGDLSIRAAAPRDAEVAELVGGFNVMVDALVGTQAALSDANAVLEQRVHERTETLRTFIDVAPQAIVSVDLDWRVTRWNRAAERLFGWTADEIVGQPFPCIPPEGRDGFRVTQENLGNGRAMTPFEAARLCKDGSRVTVLVSNAVLRDRDQRPVGYVGVLTDLTDRKALESQLRQSQKMEAVGRLAGGMAHDFNNILTVITASASLLLDSELHDEARGDVEEIATAAQRAAGLTRQLLAFTRSQVVRLDAVSINDITTKLLPMLRRLMRENIRFTFIPDDKLALIKADASQVEQVLMNLLVNASDAMPDGGSVEVTTRNVVLNDTYARDHVDVSPGEYVQLVVRDTGVGMTPPVLTRVFEPFFTTKPVGKGTGLGLATTYAIVQRLGGHIEVHSRVGEGTTFTIYVPICEGGARIDASVPDAEADNLSGQETILLVEDEDAVRAALKRTLEHLGYTVLTAVDGEHGLAMVDAHTSEIDVVVTDVMMPGMSGRAMADLLQAKYPQLRVIFISGYADEAIRDRGFVDSTHTFLHKPFTGRHLAKTVRQMLGQLSTAH